MMTAEDEAGLSPPVFKTIVGEKSQRKNPRRLRIHEEFLLLSASQLVCLVIGAFFVGACIPMLIFKVREENHGKSTRMHTLEPTEPEIWNNLRQFPRSHRTRNTTSGNTTDSGLKIAWRK